MKSFDFQKGMFYTSGQKNVPVSETEWGTGESVSLYFIFKFFAFSFFFACLCGFATNSRKLRKKRRKHWKRWQHMKRKNRSPDTHTISCVLVILFYLVCFFASCNISGFKPCPMQLSRYKLVPCLGLHCWDLSHFYNSIFGNAVDLLFLRSCSHGRNQGPARTDIQLSCSNASFDTGAWLGRMYVSFALDGS